MPHFKAFGMINFQYEIRIGIKFLIKPQMAKNSQDNNWIIISNIIRLYKTKSNFKKIS